MPQQLIEDMYNKLYQEKEDYKSRCEKAIEKIRKLGLEIQEDEGISWQIADCDEIINILQNGSEKDE